MKVSDPCAGNNYDAGIGPSKLSCYQQKDNSNLPVGLAFGLLWKDPDKAPYRHPFRTRSRTAYPTVSRTLSLLSLLSLSQLQCASTCNQINPQSQKGPAE